MGVVIIYVLYSCARNLGHHFVGQKCRQVAVSLSSPVDTVKRRKLLFQSLNDWTPGLGQFNVTNGQRDKWAT